MKPDVLDVWCAGVHVRFLFSLMSQKKQKKEQQTTLGQFSGEIKKLMYALGDAANPAPDSVLLMEELLLLELNHFANIINDNRSGNALRTSDFITALKDDPKKLARAKELLAAEKQRKEDIKILKNDLFEEFQDDQDK